jgi:hypothetical protein
VLAVEKNPKSSSEKSAADQKQFKTLSESLAVLSAEKSRMEANFQADKKKLRGEIELVHINKRSHNIVLSMYFIPIVSTVANQY